MRRPTETLLLTTLACLGAACTHLALAQSVQLQPFTATYALEWKGMAAGVSSVALERGTDGEWIYRARNRARGIFRLALPGAITQTSIFHIEGDTIVPHSYVADDGTRSTGRDVRLDFDWTRARATGVAEDHPVDLPIEPGVQDALSVQIALMQALARGESPESFQLVDESRLKEYVYTREGTARVETALGAFDTIVYRSQRPGSDRFTRTWHAPALGYVPVRAERVRGKRLEWQMTIREFRSSAA